MLDEIQNKEYVPTLFMDSKSALHLYKDPVYHERTKHIDVKYHLIRDEVENKKLRVLKVTGEENPADFGTKVVPSNKFEFCRDYLHIFYVG